MLQNIRNHTQGWIAGAIIAVLSITFALWGVQYYISTDSGGKKAVAKVAGQKITERDFLQSFQRVVQSQPKLATLQGAERNTLKQEVLSEMIAQRALSHTLTKAGFNVSTAQVRELILQNPNFMENGQFSPGRFRQLLMVNNITEQALYNRMRSQIMVSQVEGGIGASSFVLPAQIQNNYQLLNQTRDLGYVIVAAKRYEKAVHPSVKELQTAYQAMQSELMVPEQVSVQYLLLSPQAIMKTVSASQAEVENYYQTNKANFKTAMRWQVKADGKTFWINARKASNATVNILANAKVGATTKPIDTASGKKAVTLVAIDQPKELPLSDVRAQVVKAIKTQKAENILSTQADQLSNLTYTNPASLAPAAKALGLKVQTSPLFGKKGLAKGVLSNPQVVNAAFSNDVLNTGNNSDPIDMKNGGMIVLRVYKHVAAHVPAFNKVKAKVAAFVVKQDATEKAFKVANKINVSVQKGESPVTLAKSNKLIWVAKNHVEHDDSAIPQAVLNQAFFEPLQKGKVTSSVVSLDNGDFAVVKLIALSYPKTTDIPAKTQAALNAAIAQYQGKMAYAFFKKSALNHANVKVNQATLNDAN